MSWRTLGFLGCAAVAFALGRSLWPDAAEVDLDVRIEFADDRVRVRVRGLPRGTRLDFESALLARSIRYAGDVDRTDDGAVWRSGPDAPLEYQFAVTKHLAAEVGCFRIGDAVVLRPERAIPRVRGRVQFDVQSVVTTSRGGDKLLHWPSGTLFVCAGPVAGLRSGGSCAVVGVDRGTEASIARIGAAYDRLADDIHEAFGRPREMSTLLIATDRAFRGPDKLAYLSAHRSNLFLAPIAPDSPTTERRLARHCLERSLRQGRNAIESARLVALADVHVATTRAEPSVYTTEWAQDTALRVLARLGGAALRPDGLDAQEFPLQQSAIVYVLGGLLWHDRLRETTSGRTPPAARLRDAWDRLRSPGAFGRGDLLRWLAPRIDAYQPAAPTPAPALLRVTKSTAPDLVAWSGLEGIIEDCGCVASRAQGGLLRLADELRRDRRKGSIRICLGNTFALRNASASSAAADRVARQFLTEATAAVLTPADAEIAGYLDGSPEVVELWRSGALVACNLTPVPGEGVRVRPYVDARLPDGRRIRVIGVAGITGKRTRSRTRELAEARLGLQPPLTAVIAQVENTAADVRILVAGVLHPATAAAIARASPRPLTIVCSHDPISTRSRPAGQIMELALSGMVARSPIHVQQPTYISIEELNLEGAELHPVPRRIRLTQPIDFSSSLARAALEALSEDGYADRRGWDARRSDDHPLHALGQRATYVGSRACASCHEQETAHWAQTAHAKALDTLRQNQRHRVAGCVSCHVVGFEEATGYQLDTPRTELEHVGCEVCHGPGSLHVSNSGDASLIVRKPSERLCMECHKEKHSPFAFGRQREYHDRITHR